MRTLDQLGILPLLFSSILHFLAKADSEVCVYCTPSTSYSPGSVYEKNLNLILSSLAANASITGFNMTTAGKDSDVVYGLIQCRPDISEWDCQTCSSASALEIIQRCSNHTKAFIQYDNCLLHYSDRRFFSIVDSFPRTVLVNTNEVNNPVLFSNRLGSLFDSLSLQAATNPSRFAVGNTPYTGSINIYGMMQCTRDLSENNCLRCLQNITKYTPKNGSEGGQVISLSCSLRYEISPFFVLSPPPPPIMAASSPPSVLDPNLTANRPHGGNHTLRTTVVVSIPVAVAFLLVSIICGCFLWRTMRDKKKISFDSFFEGGNASTESLLIDLAKLKVATKCFSDEYKLGEGGFGPVYKGKLSDGREIAVKRLSSTSEQGLEELTTEVILVSKLLHRNLVKLLGFCLEEEEKLLVYEYLPNGSLDKILFDQSRRRISLAWERRYNIIVGIARGLLYLHEDSQLRIIHRDMKAGNILLDEYMNPKISDFGMARLFHGSQTQGNTKRIAGTYGYMAPEYAKSGHFSMKSDVYSFGVLVLEIIAGRKNSSFQNPVNLQHLARQHWANGTALDLVDPSLGDQWPEHQVLECIHIGLLCIQETAADRPSMSEIIQMLSSHTATTPVPLLPPFVPSKNDLESSETKDTTQFDQNNIRTVLQQSVNCVIISELGPRD